MEPSVYLELQDMVLNNSGIMKLMRLGFCREWSLATLKFIRKFAEDSAYQLQIEAREVNISPLLSHTFIRLIAGEERPYLMDGTGVEKHPPYFGYEDEAPEHLRNHKLDMISRLHPI